MRATPIGVLVVLVAVLPALGIAGASLDTGTAQQTEVTNGSLSPGERLAGVVSVQQAELDGELAERSFGLQLAAASSNTTRTDILATQFNDTEQRLAALEERLKGLTDRREAGEIGPGRYAAETARIEAERRSLQRLANYTARAAAELPAGVRKQRGVNVTAIRALSERASELGGQEVSEIARSIAGPRTGQSIAEQRGGGPPPGVPGGAPGNDSRPGGPPDGAPGEDEETDGPPGDTPGGDAGAGGETGDADRSDSADSPEQSNGGNRTDPEGGSGDGDGDRSSSGSADRSPAASELRSAPVR
ncbi:hypothetical protein BRC62_00580 [Halobacteriales archaeon QH_10_67_13]|nr:MAG: hypothetical protein BRC62_00580 [Halobacteriales archaeon QH_10_67_13]